MRQSLMDAYLDAVAEVNVHALRGIQAIAYGGCVNPFIMAVLRAARSVTHQELMAAIDSE